MQQHEQHARAGQSLIEVLVAAAVGTILIVGAVTVIVPAIRGNTQAQFAEVATGLARELLDTTQAAATGNWSTLYSLSKGSTSSYFLITSVSPFTVATGTESVALDGNTGLIGHWKLDETVTTIANNFASSTSVGTSTGSPTATTTCRIGGCWSFNGSSQWVNAGNASVVQIATGTIAAWIKTSNAGGSFRGIIAKQASYGMFLLDNEFGMYDWAVGWRGSGVSLNDNQWHHVACSFQSGVANGTFCYIDGVLRLTTTITVTGQGATVQIGEANAGGGQAFAGLIDDARLYNRALSASEVQRLYNAQVYTRYFYVENVGRDGSGNILVGGGANDPSTQRVTVVYAWPRVATRTIDNYITRNRSYITRQTDWAGGAGTNGPTTSTASTFATSSNVDVSTTTGSIRINGL